MGRAARPVFDITEMGLTEIRGDSIMGTHARGIRQKTKHELSSSKTMFFGLTGSKLHGMYFRVFID